MSEGDRQTVLVRFEGLSVAEANRQAGELADFLRQATAGAVEAERRKE